MSNNYEPIDSVFNSFHAYRIGKQIGDKNPADKFKIGNQEFSKTGALLGGVSLLGSIGSYNERNQRQQITEEIRANSYNQDYVNVLTDNRYGSQNVDMFNNSSFKEGGQIPKKYKEMGFTKVGQEKKSTREGKKWQVLAKKGDKYKVVHGGAVGMEDFSQHHDKQRRENFWSRMGGKDSKQANDPFSPMYWYKRNGRW